MADDETETDAEKQVRLHHEKECRRIADMVKAELPEDRGFILITAQRGEAGAPFSTTDYVATINPRDALRLLREFIGRISRRTGVVGEPTEETATVMREHVYAMLEGLEGKPPPSPSKMWQAFCRARAGQGSVRERIANFVGLGVVAMVELEHLRRAELKKARPSSPPPSGRRASGDTKTTLVADLRQRPPSAARDHLIQLALAGHYHDYESPSPMPKVALHDALIQAGYTDLALGVINGAYDDEPPTSEQEEELRQEVGPEFFDKVMGNKPRGQS